MRAAFEDWPWRVEPHESELLSSFLIRVAWRHGSSPTRFCALHFPSVHVWNRDIDRSAPDALIDAVAIKAGLSVGRVERMTLRGEERQLSSRTTKGVASWINPLGIYHRVRHLHGLQYCPQCLAGGEPYDKAWRLTFVTVCPRHLIQLRDSCPYCDAPVLPHRQMPYTLRCHTCHLLIIHKMNELAPSYSIGTFQETCLSVLERGIAWLGNERIDAASYFRGLRVMASVYLRVGERLSLRAHGIVGQSSLERSRVAARHAWMGTFFSLFENWPEAFFAVAREENWTQRAFVRGPLPKWMSNVIRELPAGRVRRASSRRLQLRLKALSRVRTADWRSERAALLCAVTSLKRS